MKDVNIKKFGKKFLVGLGLSVFMLGIGGVTYADSLKEKQAKEIEQRLILNKVSKSGLNLISSDEAKDIALKTAEVNPKKVQYIKAKLEEEDDYKIVKGKRVNYVYEVEFLHNGFEYEFDIDAETKEVIKIKVDSWQD